MADTALHNDQNPTDPYALYLVLAFAALLAGHLTDHQADAFAAFGQLLAPFLSSVIFGRR